jgi:hypothetical protein
MIVMGSVNGDKGLRKRTGFPDKWLGPRRVVVVGKANERQPMKTDIDVSANRAKTSTPMIWMKSSAIANLGLKVFFF